MPQTIRTPVSKSNCMQIYAMSEDPLQREFTAQHASKEEVSSYFKWEVL